MSGKTFADYKQELREYLAQYSRERKGESRPGDITTSERDIVELTENLRRTFPKEAIPGDHAAMCYAYYHREMLLMPDDYRKQWRKHTKAYIKAVPAGENDSNLYFAMIILGKTTEFGSPRDSFEYAEQAVKKMSKQGQNTSQTKEILSKIARKYYDFLIQEIDKNNPPTNVDEFITQRKRCNVAAKVLIRIPEGSRDGEAEKLCSKMWPSYSTNDAWRREGWRREYYHQVNLIKQRVYKSYSSGKKTYVNNQASKNRYRDR